jgi:hypothetical protein
MFHLLLERIESLHSCPEIRSDVSEPIVALSSISELVSSLGSVSVSIELHLETFDETKRTFNMVKGFLELVVLLHLIVDLDAPFINKTFEQKGS